MNNDNFKISKLIYKDIANILESEEAKSLKLWFKEDSRHLELYEKIKDNSEYKFESYSDINTNKAWETFKQQNTNRKSIKRLRIIYSIASCLILGLIMSSIFIFENKNSKLDNLDGIIAGKSSATLILENGKKIKLDKNAISIKDYGSIIKSINSKIQYFSTNNTTCSYHKILIPVAGEYSLELADRTRIWVNSETSLSYPTSFKDLKERKVYLDGEAYFEVSKNKDKPFIVVTPKETIAVLGTKFNINSYKDDPFSHTTLISGSVRIKNNSTKEQSILKPGEQASINSKTKFLSIKKVNAKKYTDWIDGRFVFEDETLESITNKLSRWYNIEFKFKFKEAQTLCFTGNFIRYDKISTILQMFEMTNKVHFSLENNKIIVKVPIS